MSTETETDLFSIPFWDLTPEQRLTVRRITHQAHGEWRESEFRPGNWYYHMTDWRGRSYQTGDGIVYPRMSGRSCEMSDGMVTDIWETRRDREKWEWVRKDPGAPWQEGDEWRVQIQPYNSSRDFGRGGWGHNADKPLSKVTIIVIDNITVIDASARAS